MNALNINWQKFVELIIPSFLRKPKIKAYVLVLLTPVIDLFATLTGTRTSLIDQAQLNILTDILQAQLRVDYPNVTNFKVHVSTEWDKYPQAYDQYLGEHHLQEYTMKHSEAGYVAQHDWFDTELLLPFEYEVIVPVTYTANAPQIIVFLNRYRPAGRRYNLKFENKV